MLNRSRQRNCSPRSNQGASAATRTERTRRGSRSRKSPGTLRERVSKERVTQPKEVIAAGKKRELETEDFKRLFSNTPQASQGQDALQGDATRETISLGEGSPLKERRIGPAGRNNGPQGVAEGKAASSATGRRRPIPTHNRFAELDDGGQAQEVAKKADADKEDRSKDSWDQARRNKDIAKRKQQWREESAGKEEAQRLEEAQTNTTATGTGGKLGTDPSEAASSAHPFGSSTLEARGPEWAGGAVPAEQPPP